mmetsp:Transcript_31360/g.43511  ORF Transcript_31360/g.43511 Transcript_31360/m.43511 type:complete len:177 (-) Transcript_31360:235-765(-)|eukprot:CAMPEP_0196578940 /NCGR_PEP_ID=MMETSP1081-20130531/13586_1 /TAXON_ID=36882 /ORGANISM="Pyramimonas amylifera, Strain CCMP720" /LENGTH=176 /DNA_ID=CAMNT_0041898341 /DNA_START=147 /DNA_END=677 /DNA_ORIENTATION=+
MATSIAVSRASARMQVSTSRTSALSARTHVATPMATVANRQMSAKLVSKNKTERFSVNCSMAKLMEKIDSASLKNDLMSFQVGHDVSVGVQVKEGAKTRVQMYQGVIIAMHKSGLSSTITVRKMVQGVGVERVFPIHSPLCSFEPVAGAGTPQVRRAKLYYLRELKGKQARLKIKY